MVLPTDNAFSMITSALKTIKSKIVTKRVSIVNQPDCYVLILITSAIALIRMKQKLLTKFKVQFHALLLDSRSQPVIYPHRNKKTLQTTVLLPIAD